MDPIALQRAFIMFSLTDDEAATGVSAIGGKSSSITHRSDPNPSDSYTTNTCSGNGGDGGGDSVRSPVSSKSATLPTPAVIPSDDVVEEKEAASAANHVEFWIVNSTWEPPCLTIVIGDGDTCCHWCCVDNIPDDDGGGVISL